MLLRDAPRGIHVLPYFTHHLLQSDSYLNMDFASLCDDDDAKNTRAEDIAMRLNQMVQVSHISLNTHMVHSHNFENMNFFPGNR